MARAAKARGKGRKDRSSNSAMPALLASSSAVAHTIRENYAACEAAWAARGKNTGAATDTDIALDAAERWAIKRYTQEGHTSINGAFLPMKNPKTASGDDGDRTVSLSTIIGWQAGPETGAGTAAAENPSEWCKARDMRMSDVPAMLERMAANVSRAVASLDAVMARKAARMPAGGMALFRGVRAGGGDAAQYAKAAAGSTIVIPSFTSVSLDPNVSRMFANGQKNTVGLLVVIQAPAGTPFVFMNAAKHAKATKKTIDYDYSTNERELLLPRGMRLKVLRSSEIEDISTDIYREKTKLRVVFCEIEPPSPLPVSPLPVSPPVSAVTLPVWWMDKAATCTAQPA
jgi:hypothetical protein